MEDLSVQVLMLYFNLFGNSNIVFVKLSKLFLKTLIIFPIARIFSFLLLNPITGLNKEMAIKLLVETILFVPGFSLTFWYFKNKKNGGIN